MGLHVEWSTSPQTNWSTGTWLPGTACEWYFVTEEPIDSGVFRCTARMCKQHFKYYVLIPLQNENAQNRATTLRHCNRQLHIILST